MKAWHRHLWGVEFQGTGTRRLSMLGTAWLDPMAPARYVGEPARALLFTSRVAARNWCQAKTKRSTYGRFRPIRVFERLDEEVAR